MNKSTESSPSSETETSANLNHNWLAPRGQLELIIGPMFAGKSTELLRRVKRHQISGRTCLRIKFVADSRYSNDCIATHDNQVMKAQSYNTLAEVGEEWRKYDVIGIDEGQFFEDIVEFSEKAANGGKIVIIAALDRTFLRTGFETIMALIPKAEKIKKFAAVCKHCGQSASFTFRFASEDDTSFIGGAEMYKPLCRPCFNEAQEKQKGTRKLSGADAYSSVQKHLNLKTMLSNDDLTEAESLLD